MLLWSVWRPVHRFGPVYSHDERESGQNMSQDLPVACAAQLVLSASSFLPGTCVLLAFTGFDGLVSYKCSEEGLPVTAQTGPVPLGAVGSSGCRLSRGHRRTVGRWGTCPLAAEPFGLQVSELQPSWELARAVGGALGGGFLGIQAFHPTPGSPGL